VSSLLVDSADSLECASEPVMLAGPLSHMNTVWIGNLWCKSHKLLWGLGMNWVKPFLAVGPELCQIQILAIWCGIYILFLMCHFSFDWCQLSDLWFAFKSFAKRHV